MKAAKNAKRDWKKKMRLERNFRHGGNLPKAPRLRDIKGGGI
jgi:hypothetical protein